MRGFLIPLNDVNKNTLIKGCFYTDKFRKFMRQCMGGVPCSEHALRQPQVRAAAWLKGQCGDLLQFDRVGSKTCE